jgi:hypothetical protein
MFETAKRIVEIQRLLTVGGLEANVVENLLAEQRGLWDREYAGEPFDRIAKDAWLTKKNLYL